MLNISDVLAGRVRPHEEPKAGARRNSQGGDEAADAAAAVSTAAVADAAALLMLQQQEQQQEQQRRQQQRRRQQEQQQQQQQRQPDTDLAVDALLTHDEHGLQEAKRRAFDLATVRRFMGADVLSLFSVPVFICEPTTMHQKMAEIMEYVELLDRADGAKDPLERMALVAAFFITPFGAVERTWKPFNPLLGETYEMEGLGPNRDGRYFAEQVSHHPPIGAGHAESPRWEYDIVSAPKTKFLGNSLEVFPYGRSRVRLRGAGETYSHVPPHVKVHSLILGRTWVDVEGHFSVACPDSGARCQLDFTPCGWFNAHRYEFTGHVTDAAGVRQLRLSGLWCSHVDVVACGPDGAPRPDAAPKRVWQCAAKPKGDPYGMTAFAAALSACAALRTPPLPSDSRRRPDRAALAARAAARAGAEKARLEDAQRRERSHRAKLRGAGGGSGAEWVPRWFEEDPSLELLPGEHDLGRVPGWVWRRDTFDRLDRVLSAGAGGAVGDPGSVQEADVCGVGFAPWSFPELHAAAGQQ